MSKWHSPIELKPSFFWIVAFVIVSTLICVAILWELGWGGASMNLIYPASPWSWSHHLSAGDIKKKR